MSKSNEKCGNCQFSARGGCPKGANNSDQVGDASPYSGTRQLLEAEVQRETLRNIKPPHVVYVPTDEEAKSPQIAQMTAIPWWMIRIGSKWASRRTIDEICSDALRDAPEDTEYRYSDNRPYSPPDTSDTLGWPHYDRVRAVLRAALHPEDWNPQVGTRHALQLMVASMAAAGPALWRGLKYDPSKRRGLTFNEGIADDD